MRNALCSLVFRFSLFLLAWMPFAPDATASIIIQRSDEEMAKAAHTIALVRVLRMEARWEAKEKRIFSYITLAVVERYKGDASEETLTIRQIGGAINQIGSHVPGSARFKVGEESVVYLEKQHDPRYFHVMGMAYGKLQIIDDPKTQIRYLSRDARDIATARLGDQGKMSIQHPKKEQPIRLDAFVQRLQHYLRPPALKQPITPRPAAPSLPTQPTPPKTK